MDDYIVSARKYRPMTFSSVVGQTALTTTLKNAVKSGKLAHAYLFCGPRGVGKTTCARIFAKAINCQNPTPDGEACNECESCKSFNEGRSLNIFELDAASNNGVEQIKTLMEQTRVPPQVGRYKVFIIDEVHMLSTAAFNAFLKTLEEPPAHVIFILATTEKNKVLPTIISRCQIYDFDRMSVPQIVNHLKMVAEKEHISYEERALDVIAEKADGGMRDALSIFDQAASFSQGNITYEKVIEDLNVLDSDNYFNMIDLAIENKVSDLMLLLNSLISKGFDAGNMVNGLARHVRNVLMAKDDATLPLLEVSERQRQRYQEQAKKCPTQFLYKALQIMNRCDINYRQSSNKRLLVELTLIEVAQLTQPDDAAAGAGRSPKRLKSLFKTLVMSQPKAAQQVAAAEKTVTRRARATGHAVEVPQLSHEPQPTSKHIKLNSLGVTFNAMRQTQQTSTTSNVASEPSTDEERRFTQDELELQWLSLCNRMPANMAGLASRMKNMHPYIADYPHVEVKIDNQLLLDQVNAVKGRIQSTLAGLLHNANVTFETLLAKADEVKPILTKREMFNQMAEDNPAVAKLRDAFNLQLI